MLTKVSNAWVNSFQDAGVFIECFIDKARHVEVQILVMEKGQVVAFGERDCSFANVVTKSGRGNLRQIYLKRHVKLHQGSGN